ncbi:hypothetical protein PV325_000988 [Microctonus aethiopoides]|nr:hypothetical protein PV325_000988 [Microctonus aethiopoides]KAK0093210.1 hypothetical protein PV326_014065 [Microctonus aethiopoides]
MKSEHSRALDRDEFSSRALAMGENYKIEEHIIVININIGATPCTLLLPLLKRTVFLSGVGNFSSPKYSSTLVINSMEIRPFSTHFTAWFNSSRINVKGYVDGLVSIVGNTLQVKEKDYHGGYRRFLHFHSSVIDRWMEFWNFH